MTIARIPDTKPITPDITLRGAEVGGKLCCANGGWLKAAEVAGSALRLVEAAVAAGSAHRVSPFLLTAAGEDGAKSPYRGMLTFTIRNFSIGYVCEKRIWCAVSCFPGATFNHLLTPKIYYVGACWPSSRWESVTFAGSLEVGLHAVAANDL